MAEAFKFQKKEKIYFNVEVDGILISLPVGGSMSAEAWRLIGKITELSGDLKDGADDISRLMSSTEIYETILALFEEVLTSEQTEKIGLRTWAVEDIGALFTAWQKSAKQLQGLTLGESQASEDS